MASVPQSDRITVWRNARLATMSEHAPGFGLVSAGAVAARDGRIAYAGPEAELPAELARMPKPSTAEAGWSRPA